MHGCDCSLTSTGNLRWSNVVCWMRACTWRVRGVYEHCVTISVERFGSTDFDQLRHEARYHTSDHDAPLKPGPRAAARAQVRSRLQYLRNYWSNRAQIWHAAKHHTCVNDASHKPEVLYCMCALRTCAPLFCIYQTTGPIKIKCGMQSGMIYSLTRAPLLGRGLFRALLFFSRDISRNNWRIVTISAVSSLTSILRIT